MCFSLRNWRPQSLFLLYCAPVHSSFPLCCSFQSTDPSEASAYHTCLCFWPCSVFLNKKQMTAGLIHSLFPGNVVFPHLNIHSGPHPTVLLPTDIRISPEFQLLSLGCTESELQFHANVQARSYPGFGDFHCEANFVICSDSTDCRGIWHIFLWKRASVSFSPKLCLMEKYTQTNDTNICLSSLCWVLTM